MSAESLGIDLLGEVVEESLDVVWNFLMPRSLLHAPS